MYTINREFYKTIDGIYLEDIPGSDLILVETIPSKRSIKEVYWQGYYSEKKLVQILGSYKNRIVFINIQGLMIKQCGLMINPVEIYIGVSNIPMCYYYTKSYQQLEEPRLHYLNERIKELGYPLPNYWLVNILERGRVDYAIQNAQSFIDRIDYGLPDTVQIIDTT
jgi:hypothetical protein